LIGKLNKDLCAVIFEEHCSASNPSTPYKIYINMYLQIYPIPNYSEEKIMSLRGISVNPQAKYRGVWEFLIWWKMMYLMVSRLLYSS